MRRLAALWFSLCLSGCGEAQKPPPPIEPAVAQYVLEEVPSDVQNRLLIDFGGKVHLIGYDIEPDGIAKPGTKFKLRMYWKSVSRLDPGWSLFTHLVGPNGKRLEKGGLDDVGPLRARSGPSSTQALGPSDWLPGKVYVDEQDLEVPPDVNVPEFNVLVGIWRPANLRLSVIGGPSDKEERGIVTTIKTGVSWPDPTKPADSSQAAAGRPPGAMTQRPMPRPGRPMPGMVPQPGIQPGQPGMPQPGMPQMPPVRQPPAPREEPKE
jgi:hypothetical protein